MKIIEQAIILAIDDEPFELMLINTYLGHQCKQLILQDDPFIGMELASHKQPDIILLDVNMPRIDGYEVCKQLKSRADTRDIPVIFLSGYMDTIHKVKGFDAGGVDYITKPFEFEEILARISSSLSIHQKIQASKTLHGYPKLTERELMTVSLYALGHKRAEIADQLCVADSTVKWYLKNIFSKLNVQNRTQLIEKALELGLIKTS